LKKRKNNFTNLFIKNLKTTEMDKRAVKIIKNCKDIIEDSSKGKIS